jgi:hypothetical protein
VPIIDKLSGRDIKGLDIEHRPDSKVNTEQRSGYAAASATVNTARCVKSCTSQIKCQDADEHASPQKAVCRCR